MKLRNSLQLWAVGVVGLTLSLLCSQANANSAVYNFTFENDGDLPTPPFGTVTVNDNTTDQLSFSILADTTKLGANADLHQFGFMLNFGGTISLVSASNSGTLTMNDNVQGRNGDFDYVVNFGPGAPIVNPANFVIQGTGLTLTNLLFSDVQTQNNKPDANFMAHVQNTTTIINTTSEAIGGRYSPVPVPAAVWLFGSGLAAFGLIGRRK